MEQEKSITRFVFVLLILLICSCTIDSNDVAISSDEVQIAFNQKGKGKPAIIFVHGWTNPKEIWEDQIEHFSQKYKVVAVDLAGSGESGNNRRDWTITAFADDVVSVVDKLNLKSVVLVGFSMGAPVVVEAANKLSEKTIGVVIVDAIHDPEVKFSPQVITFMDSVMMNLVTNMTNENLVTMGFYKNNHESSFNRIQKLYPENISKVGWNESLLGNFKWINTKCTSSLESLKVPLIAINSDLQPTKVESFKKYVPSFKAKIMTDVGHLLFWDNPEQFNKLLEESIQEFRNKK
jgi:pimeloyl-ACP methyl ester carboxylesterase